MAPDKETSTAVTAVMAILGGYRGQSTQLTKGRPIRREIGKASQFTPTQQITMSTKKMSVFVEPYSLFRYISELDPVKHEEGRGNTKGGYLGGRIELPSFKDEIRVVISTHQDTENCMHDNESNRCHHHMNHKL